MEKTMEKNIVKNVVKKKTSESTRYYLHQLYDERRGVVIDWMLDVMNDSGLDEETFYAAVFLLDDLVDKLVKRNPKAVRKTQLLAVSCLVVVSFLRRPLCPYEAVYLCANAYNMKQLRKMTFKIVKLLGFAALGRVSLIEKVRERIAKDKITFDKDQVRLSALLASQCVSFSGYRNYELDEIAKACVKIAQIYKRKNALKKLLAKSEVSSFVYVCWQTIHKNQKEKKSMAFLEYYHVDKIKPKKILISTCLLSRKLLVAKTFRSRFIETPDTLAQKMGQGGYGDVYKANLCIRGEQMDVALKHFRSENFPTVYMTDDAVREMYALSVLKHRKIVDMVGWYCTPKKAVDEDSEEREREVVMVTELLGNTVQNEFTQPASTAQEMKRRLRICIQLMKAVKYVHSRGFIHRDLCPKNIMITKKEDKEELKLIDFGVSVQRHVRRKEEIHTETVQKDHYRAPEAHYGKGIYDEKIDIWACACIIYKIFTGKDLFPGAIWDYETVFSTRLGAPGDIAKSWAKYDENMNRKYPEGKGVPEIKLPGVERVVMEMLDFDSKKRPSAEKVLEMLKRANSM